MSDLDSLSIQITSDSKKAEDAIEGLIRGLTNLNNALGNLDVSKITAFTNAVSKLSNIGSTTNTTSKALRGMSNQLSKTFGIKSKEGIKDLNVALNDFYEATKRSSKDSSLPTQQMYVDSAKALHKAITENASYKKELRDDVRIVKDFYDAQKANGSVFSLKGYKDLFDDKTWAEYKKSLGSVFTFKKFSNQQGVGDIENFFSSLYKKIPDKAFFSDPQNPLDTAEAIKKLVEYLDEARNSTLRYKEAVDSQVISGNEAKEGVIAIGEQLKALVREQNEFSGENGLKGVVSAMQALGSVKLPDMTGAATALKNVQKVITETSQKAPDIKNISTATDEVKQSFDNAASSAANFSESLVGIRNSKRVIEGARANIGDLTPVERGFVITEDVKQLPAVIQDYSKYAEEAYNKIQSLANITDEAAESSKKFTKEMQDAAEKPSLDNIEKGAERVKTALEEVIEKAREYKQVISEMESGKRAFDPQQYEDAIKGYDQATKKIQEYKKSLTGGTEKPTVTEGVLPQLVVLGKELGELSHKFGELGNKAIGLFKGMVKPLQWASGEYVEKFRGMQETIQNFQMKFRASMKKVSDFWKRTMRTFTFMIVRKAIDAVVKEVGTAIQSLAMYSNAMGTAFNTDISNMVADFQYLGRSIVSVFAPLLNYIAPIIDAIVDKIATLISYIGMLFAALGGSTSFTKAKKNVGNYAESLDQASKSAKNLTMGIDELNIISDQKSSGSAKPYDGWEDAWEDVEIPDWITDLADKLRDLWDKLLAPLKEAWARTKENFLLAWDSMIKKLLAMFKAIGEAFLKVWNEEKTIQLIQKIINSVANLMLVVGNLAENFTKAWLENERGVQIFEKIRDIIDKLATHFENLTAYMYFWSQGVTFDALLDSVITLLGAFEKLADFIGGVFYDVMTRVVLKHIEWLIEVGIPELNEAIASVIESFNFDKIREDLQPLEDAISRFLENIHVGSTKALENLGKQVADFANSKEFTDFLQRLADILDLLSAEDVEKILTGIGKGILSIAKSVVKFVNSDTFMSFLKALDKWLDKASADDIANILTKIAKAIALFKFAEFAGAGLAGFFKLLAILKSMSDLSTIASSLSGVGEGAAAASSGIGAFAATLAEVVAIVGIVVAAVYSLISSFGGLDNTLQYIGNVIRAVADRLKDFAERINLSEHIDNLKVKFDELLESLGNQKHFWEIIINLAGLVADAIGGVLIIAFDMLVQALSGLIEFITGVTEVFGGLVDMVWSAGEILVGMATNDLPLVGQGVNDFFNSLSRIGEGFVTMFKGFTETVLGLLGSFVNGFFEGFLGILTDLGIFSKDWETQIRSWWDDKVMPWFTWDRWVQLCKNIADNLDGIIEELINFVGEWAEKIQNWWNENVAPWFTLEKWAEVVSSIKTSLEGIITGLGTFVSDWKTSIENWWNDNVAPWFTLEKWVELLTNIKSGFDNVILDISTFIENWQIKITEWWNNYVAPWFTLEKWKELGANVIQGLSDGLTETWDKVKDGAGAVGQWIIDKFKKDTEVSSPSKKAKEVGEFVIEGLFLPFSLDKLNVLNTFIEGFLNVFRVGLSIDKFELIGTQIVEGLINPLLNSTELFITTINNLFVLISETIINNITLLGETLLNETLPMFMETYILPFFSIDLWQPYFDILLNEVFMVSFENFLVWFDEQMNAWWTDHMVIWFEASKWNKDLFDPVKKNYTDRYKNFILWFDKSIKDWWENKMMPYFKVAFWNSKIFDPLKQNRETRYQTFITWFTRSIKDWWENKLMPYFKVTFWNEKIYEPLKQNRESRYKAFIDWFSKSIKDWWENKLMPYLKVSFWDSEIFNPLKESIQTHFKNFVSWWILSMNLWWTADVVPYFKQDRWQEQFDHIKVVAEEVFSYIERFITENINKAKDSVVNACNSMIESLSDVLNRLHDIEDTLRRLQDMGFDIGNFEMGGFPNEGSLFFAGERGAELIGSVNGRTAVTSNDEITGIREAIAESGNQEAAYLSQLIAITTQLLDKDPVVIGDRDIAEMAESGKNLLGMQIIT